MKQKVFTQEQIDEILKAEKEADNKYEIKRLMVLRLRAVEKMPAKEIGRIVGYPPASVNNILSKYFKDGLESMLGENRKGGNKRYLTESEENQILQEFESQAEDGKILIVADIKKAYEKASGKQVPKSTIYRMLKRQGWRKVMPRSKHPKSKPEEFSAYKKNHG
jgi:transposase